MDRVSLLACSSLLVLACGGSVAPRDATSSDRDAGALADAGASVDAAASDAWAASDTGVTHDAARVPEICDNGIDDDGDTLVDCADDDCWSIATCAATHVGTIATNLVACHDPIVRSVMDEDTACATIGTPMGSTYPTQCAGDVDVTATIRFFCDASMAVRAAWMLEHATLPRTQTMLGPRRFDQVRYEHASILDWEHYASGSRGTFGSGTRPRTSARVPMAFRS